MGQRLSIAAGVAASLSLLGWLVGSHWNQLLELWGQVRFEYLAAGLGSAAGAYLCLGAAQWSILRSLGYRVRYREVAGIAMAGQSANMVLGFSGAAGTALRAHLLKRRGVPYGKTMTLVVVYSLCGSATLALLAGQGLLLSVLHLSKEAFPIPWTGSSISILAPLLIAFGLAATMYHHDLRARYSTKLFRAVNRVVFLLSKRQIPEHHFEAFDRDLTGGLRKIWERRGHMTKPLFFATVDWFCTFGVLYFAFRALDIEVPTGPLILGFALGVMTTSIPLLPGGLGVMEGAMMGLFAGFDVDPDAALLAALVFRFLYHLLPIAVSLALFPWLQRARHSRSRLLEVPS